MRSLVHRVPMQVVDALRSLGGVSTRAALDARCPRRSVDQAVASGDIIRKAHGRYALPEVDKAQARAHGLTAALCLTSAALHHGWAVKTVPDEPHLLIDKHRKLTTSQKRGVQVHRTSLGPDDLDGIATSKDRTLEMCLRMLPPDEALAIADSALRSGYQHTRLVALCRDARGPGSAQMRLIASLADERAANPFESVLRWICFTVTGLSVEAQKVVTGTDLWARSDLVDVFLRLILEADSFEWHGKRAALRRDCQRYNAMVVNDWVVLRFPYEDVMFEPEQVRAVIERAVALRSPAAA